MSSSGSRHNSGGQLGTNNGRGSSNTNRIASRDELFHILRNRRRRFALHYLKREPQPVEIGALATQIAAWENEVSPEEVTSEQRRRVYNALYQTHLQALEAAGLVHVDGHEVELTEDTEQVELYLERVPEDDVPWTKYYIVFAGVQVSAVTTVWLGIEPLSSIPGTAMAAVGGIALLLSAIVHHYDQRQSRIGEKETPPELDDEVGD